MILLQKSLTQLNTVFPTLNLKPPTKQSQIRSLIQQIKCPSLTNNDMQQLQNIQNSSKIVSKIGKIVSIWGQLLNNNERARQQIVNASQGNANGGTSREIQDYIQEIQDVIREAAEIGDQEQFIGFVKARGAQLQTGSRNVKGVKDYRQVYICKQIQFYNTITPISQQQYFVYLQQLTQKLGTLQQLVHSATPSAPKILKQVQSSQLFSKKDNPLNRVINYTLQLALQLSSRLGQLCLILYTYEELLIFSTARMYYLLYLCEREIRENQAEWAYLGQIREFISQDQRIYVKLYALVIDQMLMKLEEINYQFINNPYPRNPQFHSNQKEISGRIKKIQEAVANNKGNIKQNAFVKIYQQIQSLLVQVNTVLDWQQKNQQMLQHKLILVKMQQQLVKIFIGQSGKNNGIQKDGSSKKSHRNFLGIQNSRLSIKSKQLSDKKSHKNQQNTHNIYTLKSAITGKSGQQYQNENQNKLNQVIDYGQDVFLFIYPETNTLQAKAKIQTYNKNPQLYQKDCQLYLSKIQPGFGEKLEDAFNFGPEILNTLIEAGQMTASATKQRQILMLINRSLIRLQISQDKVEKIFRPQLRFNVLKMLYDKLVQMLYKNTRILDNPQSQNLPSNIKGFAQIRNSFLKTATKQLQKILGISKVIYQLKPLKTSGSSNTGIDIIHPSTYQTFLKILLAIKQTTAYELSFKDQKNISKQTQNFVNNKLFQPFLQFLNHFLPEPFNRPREIINILGEIQYFVEFYEQTQHTIQRYYKQIQGEKDKQNLQGLMRQMARQLGKWVNQTVQKISDGKNQFDYSKAQMQLMKIRQIIKVCNRENRQQIRDKQAQKLQKLLVTKQ